MYDGKGPKAPCWGYGNKIVRWDGVCDAWASEDPRDAVKQIWRDHRRKLKEANG